MFLRTALYAVSACIFLGLQPASAVELTRTQQLLADGVAAGCAKLELKRIAAEKRPDFCKCMGEQTVISLTADDYRVMSQNKEQGQAIIAEKAGPAAQLCRALFK